MALDAMKDPGKWRELPPGPGHEVKAAMLLLARKLIGLPNAYTTVTPPRRQRRPGLTAGPTATAVHQLLACAIAEELASDVEEVRSFYDHAVGTRGLPDPDLKVLWSEALSSRLYQLAAVEGYTVDAAGWDGIEELVRRAITAVPLTTRYSWLELECQPYAESG